ncbi:MAG: hypothetical protein QNJ84_09670 [Alphaproteobacteria bacterium]|nr:hypothetical protein [Alphaproteobacteria bacterium]
MGAKTFLGALGVMAGVAALALTEAKPTLASDGPELPFERYLGSGEGGKPVLRFNDFSGRITGDRIKALLRSGEILGDRVLLQNGSAVYFPEGYIVSSSIAFDRYRPKDGVPESSVDSPDDLELNPTYDLTNSFDQVLGPVCAETAGKSPGTTVRLRKNASGVVSLVEATPGRYNAVSGEESVGYRVLSATAAPFLPQNNAVQSMLSECDAN